MQVNVRYLDNLKLEALFDDFKVLTDQPIRYKGDGTAPGPFDYFLASSALCAAYFVKIYCKSRGISTDDISVVQDNIVDPENRYKQTFKIILEIPDYISEKDREGMIAAIDRCTVKRTIQNAPDFIIEARTTLQKSNNIVFDEFLNQESETFIKGKDASLEQTIKKMTQILEDLGIKIEISSWRNPVPHVWSVHIRDAEAPMCYTNGKGASKEAALCSALGEYLERLSCNYFYADYFIGQSDSFAHYPDEKWFEIENEKLPAGLLDDYTKSIYDSEDLTAYHLVDTNSGLKNRICALPFERQSDKELVYFPVNLIGNLYVSNGMSAGNSKYEARVQCLSEIFERAVKNEILANELCLPDIPKEILNHYPSIKAGIKALEDKGYPVLVKDASLGGRFPVTCVTLLNPITGGVFASFGAHPSFEVALERTLTELLQGRSFEGLNEMPAPTFNSYAVREHNNLVEHFIDSNGVVSWKFLAEKPDFEFKSWDFSGSSEEEFHTLMNIFNQLEKEVYIADYEDLGVYACRIIVPDYSEIYEISDLVWDNNNRALDFREEILSIHSLDKSALSLLLEKLDESEIDNYMPISELIGICFDENEPWGQLVLGELKCLILLALEKKEEAKEYTEMFNAFYDGTIERRRFYQILNTVLDIGIDPELELSNFYPNMVKLHDKNLVDLAIAVAKGEKKFFDLKPTDMTLNSIERHTKMIESYKKIKKKRGG